MICLFCVNISHSSVIKDEISVVSKEEYSFNTVCKTMTNKDAPLIEVENILTLDCMSEKVAVYKFCAKKYKDDPLYARGIIDKKKNLVLCIRASLVDLKVSCKNTEVDCLDSELSCESLKLKFAANLKLNHHSILTSLKGEKSLSCYFAKKLDLKLPKVE